MSDGLSAFEIARRYHHYVDEREWLKSLRGRPGEQGVKGDPGEPGQSIKGDRGIQGKAGIQGEIGPMPRHQWEGTKLRFEMQSGEWGQWVDLKGPGGTTTVVGGVAAPISIVSWFPVVIV